MYSLVLMAALTSGGEAPACHWHGRASCWSCSGCSGCYGGCHGCYGGCYGGCYSGCFSACYGCYGGCYGCYGCSGMSYGCYGGCYGCYGSSYGCYGCYGCSGCYGMSVYAPAGMPVVAPATEEPAAHPRERAPDREKGRTPDRGTMDKDRGGEQVSLDRARLVVEVPVDAKLYIDGRLMKTGSKRRTFSTPLLEPGQLYYYDVRAEIAREGQPYSETRRVIVKAGERVDTSFHGMEARAPYRSNAVAGR